ncbi:unnamed protein product [marine sediment metagenome]|uniref:Uncharacterized protein n=1 Tax=marine sediment metagenome TaxID=412755 RepID=X1M6N9_9ZZZZ
MDIEPKCGFSCLKTNKCEYKECNLEFNDKGTLTLDSISELPKGTLNLIGE